MRPGSDAHVKRLVNLLGRGRTLHYKNATTLAARVLRLRLPDATPLRADLVYRAVQLVFALTFLEERGYMSDDVYDQFADKVFMQVAGAHSERLHGLVHSYAAVLADADRFTTTITADLCASLLGKIDPKFQDALAGTPAAMQKMTQLYCAMSFDDRVMIARLQ